MDFEDQLEDGGQDGDDQNGGGADMFMFGMDEKEVAEMRQNRDSVVFLIDCHKPMHERNPHNG